MTDERCRCQHKVNKHEYGVGRCVCGCGWFGSVDEFNRREAEKYRQSIGGPERVAACPGRLCMCPASNPDCQHPTCPRFPQPGHYHAMVVAVQDLATKSKRDGVLMDPHEVLAIVDDRRAAQ